MMVQHGAMVAMMQIDKEKFKMKETVKNIVDALHAAKSRREVYEALTYLPTDNLDELHDMTLDILATRASMEPEEETWIK